MPQDPFPSPSLAAPQQATGRPALIRNVARFDEVLDQVIHAPANAPRLGVFCGPSGYGKTVAASVAAIHHGALYLRAASYWSRKGLIDALLAELGVRAWRGTIATGMGLIAERLAGPKMRALILDEADFVVRGQTVELLRDLHDEVGLPIVLIGEEQLPLALRKHERVHNRVLAWGQAVPADAGDVGILAPHYCPSVELGRDLLEELLGRTGGATRRVCVNLHRIHQAALAAGWAAVDRARWGDRGWYVGDAGQRGAA